MDLRQKGFALLRRQAFRLFFISRVLTGAAASIQTIAAARLLLDGTQSGLLAGLGVLIAPLPGVLFSLIAGRVGDSAPPRGLLILYDAARAVLTLLFLVFRGAREVAAVLLLLSAADVFYSPAWGRMLTAAAGEGAILEGNSLLTGAGGVVSLIMPALAGALVGAFGVERAFIVNSALYILSALCLSAIKGAAAPRLASREKGAGGLREALRRILRRRALARAILALTALDFGTVCVNLAFYAYAFDELRVSTPFWGLVLSVLYGMNLVAMACLMRFRKFFRARPVEKAALFLPAVACVWSVYGVSPSPAGILLCAVAEGFASSMSTTLLTTALLDEAGYAFAARVTGVRDVMSAAVKASGAALAFWLLRRVRPGFVFSLGAAALFLFSALLGVWMASDAHLCHRETKNPAA
jgi:hypothetical protein